VTGTLFPDLEPVTPAAAVPVEKLSAQRRLTARQHADIEHGRHPLTRGRLTTTDGATCGNCRHRIQQGHHTRSYPKCDWKPPGWGRREGPRISHSGTSDVRAWWPGCSEHEPVSPVVRSGVSGPIEGGA
jgi:hypothetical protein